MIRVVNMNKAVRRHGLRSSLVGMMAAATAMAPAGQVWAGAWVRENDQGMAILKYSYLSGNKYFADDRSKAHFSDNGRSRQEQLNLYMEYGITDDLTLIGNFYLTRASYSSDTFPKQQTTAFGDQEAGLRYRLDPPFSTGSAWVGAVQGGVIVPAYNADSSPAVGQGGGGMELRYSIGRTYAMFGLRGYLDLGGGVRLRSGRPADELRADMVAGLDFNERWRGAVELNVIRGLGNGHRGNRQYTNSEDKSDIDSSNYDLIKQQLSIARAMGGGKYLQAGYAHPIAGRNTGMGGGPFVAFWWEF